jgi:replicative superfamily II helicase
MLRCLSRHITPGSSNSSFQAPRGTSKIIYVGPIRALVQERVQDWGDRFGRLGCTCVELTGDNDAMADNLAEADIICTTPEKFGAWEHAAL